MGSRLAGKVAIVTGAANGMGRAHVRRLAQEGASVLATDVDSAGLEQTVAAGAAADARGERNRLVDRPA